VRNFETRTRPAGPQIIHSLNTIRVEPGATFADVRSRLNGMLNFELCVPCEMLNGPTGFEPVTFGFVASKSALWMNAPRGKDPRPLRRPL